MKKFIVDNMHILLIATILFSIYIYYKVRKIEKENQEKTNQNQNQIPPQNADGSETKTTEE